MSKPVISVISARGLRGSVMGSPLPTTVLRVQIQAVSIEKVAKARSALASQLPSGFKGDLPAANSPPTAPLQATAALLAELIAAIQGEAGIMVGNPLTGSIQMAGRGSATLYLPSLSFKSCRIAISWSISWLNQLLAADQPCELTDAVNQGRDQLKPFADTSVNNAFILRAAFELGMPVFRPFHGLLMLGTGCRSRWLESLVSDETRLLGLRFAQAKHHTATLLRSAGLPGAIHQLVTTPAQAMQAAEALGYPVVVKPADADRGQGVAAGLKDADAVASAFDAAVKVSPKVLVERWAPGHTHRLTVQDGKVIRVVRRIAGGVVGDGAHTIEELVTLFQHSPQQQRFARRLGYQPLALDQEAQALLQELGVTARSRPAAGEYVRLRRRDNVNAGGTNQELVPDDPSMVHPDNLRLAIEAAMVLRLDFAGIDLITTDIARSWLEVGALICEVNARPQMGGNNDPLLYQRLLKRLFPQGATVPAELKIVPANPAAQERLRNTWLQQRSGVAVSLSSGLWIDGRRATQAFEHSFAAAQALLQRREVAHALCCMTPQDIHQHGLPLSRWDSVESVDAAWFAPEEARVLAGIQSWLRAAVQAT